MFLNHFNNQIDNLNTRTNFYFENLFKLFIVEFQRKLKEK